MGDEAIGLGGDAAKLPGGGTASAPPGLDSGRIEEWFRRHLPQAPLPLEFRVVSGGLSNLTFEVRDAENRRWVLRRPPLGERLGSAHDMGREYRVIAALQDSGVPVSPVAGFCEDETVTGAPFYVMEFVEGPVLRGPADAAAFPAASQRRRIAERLAATLALLHELDPAEVGLADLGRHDGYVERQLRRWRGQWEKSKTRELVPIDRVHRELARRVPRQGPARIVHGDFRLDNTILRPPGGPIEIAAVVDWELCTLGDPLADVGLLLVYWQESEDPPMPGFEAATRAPGFPDREAIRRLYGRFSGRDLTELDFFVALGYWKLAIILEGVLARFLAGGYGEKDPTARDRFTTLVEQLAEAAAESLE